MREADRRECLAFGRAPKQALRLSLANSLHAVTALGADGAILAMMGVSPKSMVQGIGCPWFLGTDSVFDHARALLREGPRILAWWHHTFEVMENLVSVENTKAIALLRKWGATVESEAQMIGGTEFVPFRFTAAIQA